MSRKLSGTEKNSLKLASSRLTEFATKWQWSQPLLDASIETLKSYFFGPIHETVNGRSLEEVRRRFATACFMGSLEGLPGQDCAWYKEASERTRAYHKASRARKQP